MPWIVLPWTASGRATSGRWLGLCVLVLLAGCATPQEKAITAHCEAEGTRLIAQQLVAQQQLAPGATVALEFLAEGIHLMPGDRSPGLGSTIERMR